MKPYRGKGARLIVECVREPERRGYVPSRLRSAADVAALVRFLQERNRWPNEREAIGVVLLNSQHKILGVHVASVGTVASSTFHPREVFRPAVVAGAAAVVLVHNHPSGDLRPSNDDRGVTERAREAGELLGIECLDHVIVTATSHFSFAEAT